jgi:hypothetical protein
MGTDMIRETAADQAQNKNEVTLEGKPDEHQYVDFHIHTLPHPCHQH